MMRILLVSLAFGTLSLGCTPRPLVVPAPGIPHELASECRAEVFVEHPNGQVERQKVRIPAGYWVAAPELVEGK